MSKDATLYVCKNPTCSLGTVGNPGRFTGGATAEQVLLITGDPDGAHGPGVCPNCCKPGTEDK